MSVPGVIPHELEPDHHLVVCVSGGKDSTAMALWLEHESGLTHERSYVFCDTGHEHPWTHEHVDLLARELGREVLRIHGPYTFVSLAVKKQRFPSVRARFCTEELKVKPLAKWINETLLDRIDGDPVVLQGVRREESAARAELPAWQPDQGKWRTRNYYDCPIWRPLLHWAAADVFAIHKRFGMPPNKLYLRGASRVGCFPCIHSGKADLRACFTLDPGLLPRLVDYETQVAAASKRGDASFFAADKTPARFHDKVCRTGESFASIEQVHRWAMEPGEAPLFAGFEPPTCFSQYGLCE